MAAKVKVTVSVVFDNGVSDVWGFSTTDRERSVTTGRPATTIQNVPTSQQAVSLGAAFGLGGTLCLKNLDPTNFVLVYNESGGKVIARLDPDTNQDGTGGCCVIERVGADTLAPYMKADTAACDVEVFVCPP